MLSFTFELFIEISFRYRHWTHKSPRNWPLTIILKYFQLQPTCLPPYGRHCLLQRKEGDGNKLEKNMLGSTLQGQLQCNSNKLTIQDCWSMRANLWTLGEHLGSILGRDHQHQRGLVEGYCRNWVLTCISKKLKNYRMFILQGEICVVNNLVSEVCVLIWLILLDGLIPRHYWHRVAISVAVAMV
jgi:hypothetical protein